MYVHVYAVIFAQLILIIIIIQTCCANGIFNIPTCTKIEWKCTSVMQCDNCIFQRKIPFDIKNWISLETACWLILCCVSNCVSNFFSLFTQHKKGTSKDYKNLNWPLDIVIFILHRCLHYIDIHLYTLSLFCPKYLCSIIKIDLFPECVHFLHKVVYFQGDI